MLQSTLLLHPLALTVYQDGNEIHKIYYLAFINSFRVQAVKNGTFSHLSTCMVFEENLPFPIILSSYLKYYILITEKYNLFMLHFIFFLLNIYRFPLFECIHKPLKKMEDMDTVC